MALWGNKDRKNPSGTVTLENGSTTVIGNGTVFTEDLKPGQSLVINNTNHKIAAIIDDTTLELYVPWDGDSDSGYGIQANERPAYVQTQYIGDVYGVDSGAPRYEAQLPENRAKGLKTPGWNKYITYTDSNGNVRHKTECLVAMGTIQGDANDDSVVADD